MGVGVDGWGWGWNGVVRGTEPNFKPRSLGEQQHITLILSFPCQDLERLAKEQDKETDKVNILNDVDNHRKQLHR